MGTTITNIPKRAEPKAVAAVVEKLAARFGNRLVTSQAVREQHAHTTTWLQSQPPDAVVFAQYNAARRLVERGAQTTIWQAAALGLQDRIEKYLAAETPPDSQEITGAFWHACRGGQQRTVEYLLERGAKINWLPPWDKVTPLHAAMQSGNENLVQWLQNKGAKLAAELT